MLIFVKEPCTAVFRGADVFAGQRRHRAGRVLPAPAGGSEAAVQQHGGKEGA